jgi:hypothetical protein
LSSFLLSVTFNSTRVKQKKNKTRRRRWRGPPFIITSDTFGICQQRPVTHKSLWSRSNFSARSHLFLNSFLAVECLMACQVFCVWF